MALAVMAGVQAAGQDFNGDGFDDLAIGVPGEDVFGVSDCGVVEVIYGSAAGLEADTSAGAVRRAQIWHQNRTGMADACDPGDGFGEALAFGDFNGDGFDDLAVGVPGESVASPADGAIHIIYGTPTGLKTAGNILLDQFFWPIPFTSAGDRLGWAMDSGDFNGDGVSDLLVGMPWKDDVFVNQGLIAVAFGVAGGGFAVGPVFPQGALGDPDEPGDFFGYAVAVGDFDLDGFDDAVIGAPGEDLGGMSNAGVIHWMVGSPAGPGPGPAPPLDETAVGNPPLAGERFGASLAVGDFDFNLAQDVAIGAPREDLGPINVGAVGILYSLPGIGLIPGGPGGGYITWMYQSTIGLDADEKNDRFGLTLSAGDYNLDGADDLCIGTPREGLGAGLSRAGQATIVHGGPAGLLSGPPPVEWHQDMAGVLGKANSGDLFAAGLASGDFNGDGFIDLICGVPGEDKGTKTDVGIINVLYGSAAGIGTAGNRVWHQNSPGVPQKIDSGDHFGAALGD